MTKYHKYFQEMMEENEEIFEYFKKLHDSYVEEPEFWQAKFNEEGKKVTEIVRNWERKLCRHSERGQYGKFSSNLAEKFWNEVRIHFPKIDFVGVK
ncbi:hypothetical protein COV53_06855 [Candidatus Gottesmanbacteria bacterium CG11_big_fil_rev_8_21_14_0_20_37_11]|uniref:Uncharacterized protein n=3 Tax=Candidatus Gottesmaniibacteriota TaxID=1752720 RepID=A0A2M7RRZ1_9BACT|nr:MAG: hypothetical protein AUJ73_04300 [Candidatus Gottesmanbacteria bacterium CG1_02_37_22]PIP32217.1 MAG: hypothetical protein COX23_05945 [Candidatus Gottesmanbacteria bacterium CG23_combo_of_CG06-09_8_20_14_all_37_19]PIR07713.1 MAG: hypothetical protein COV53_06855 [Candidatus Gottesmanbacteria bacterium CG11_big_fil_rev_8_21_14_0_20_37_11]PIZ03091.1 MAG: hypothetical protein COY59_01355 [Candidatus Gottesmanbacteria bacterium CG_4_10_14_0_8_um_filter_37_24]